VGPLIRPPTGVLDRGLKELETDESWAVMPHRDEQNPNLYSPAVKWHVQPDSFTHMTELFGPVLGVMKARDLHEAIGLVNRTGYGLTSGLESLDDREQALWKSRIRAGNLYINRPTTGAIVLRQPFGGMGKSAFGSGIKAGGPNYVAQLMQLEDRDQPPGQAQIEDALVEHLVEKLQQPDEIKLAERDDVARLLVAVRSYARYAQEEFACDHDHFRLVGQDNLRRYLAVREMRVRLHPADGWFDIVARVCAAKIVGCRITVSIPPQYEGVAVQQLDRLTESWAGGIEFVEETDEQLEQVLDHRQTDRLRYAAASRVPLGVRRTAAKVNLYIADAPVRCHGRIELLWYVQEQSLSLEYHRYGNLGARAGEDRDVPR
jgi:RHH-type proline utilization regulon transcriptional repressor/proline dehydrogenase/delta 1-pyrroline-5-carboxylate dehydrogenase